MQAAQATRGWFGFEKRLQLEHSARTAIAATLSVLVAGLFGLPESYWAAMTVLIVMQSDVLTTLGVSIGRLAGTALGAGLGAALATYFGRNALAFGAGVFFLGLLCSILGGFDKRLAHYLDKATYRYASITLAIVMLIAHYTSAWLVALQRFLEAAIGIAVGLVIALVWPKRETEVGQQ
jgi:uncharacterized membrane protein YgaE (UPF0421/DUF939 family)